jgi:hypothetical protein
MFNREQFMMTGVVFLLLAGTSLFLSGATVLRNKELYSNQVINSINIERQTNNLTPILDHVPAESNNSDTLLRARSRNRFNAVAVTTDNDVQSNIMYSADFNNIVDIRTESEPLSNELVILTESEGGDRERNRLDELSARNESEHNIEANLEDATGSHCVKVWDELEPEELSHTVCIELYRDNGDNVPDYEEDTLIGFTLVTNHLNEDKLDYYEFNQLPSGNYFAKFYHLGHEAPVFQAIQTVVDSHVEVDYNSWETTVIEAKAVDAGYCVRFEREENSEISDELNGLTVVPSWETD